MKPFGITGDLFRIIEICHIARELGYKQQKMSTDLYDNDYKYTVFYPNSLIYQHLSAAIGNVGYKFYTIPDDWASVRDRLRQSVQEEQKPPTKRTEFAVTANDPLLLKTFLQKAIDEEIISDGWGNHMKTLIDARRKTVKFIRDGDVIVKVMYSSDCHEIYRLPEEWDSAVNKLLTYKEAPLTVRTGETTHVVESSGNDVVIGCMKVPKDIVRCARRLTQWCKTTGSSIYIDRYNLKAKGIDYALVESLSIGKLKKMEEL